MARFEIVSSRPSEDGKHSVFSVVWRSGELNVGDVFPIYEAGHTWQVMVLNVYPTTEGADLLCDLRLGWSDQFAPAMVDTEALPPTRCFSYIHR